ncbi:hypothetical protein PAXINDRAFT_157442 [Paxillus involutus ATCC 200175]|uniref:DUF6589 domain-containing protein n=1 Tax=Paxillus involutus ATCC 200175 TaxID=664439 RepID=A0A0C9TT61_PAXIN|nr:hypothetical protein PAXINDRAFT_157442 [Paxillus involutus ATCC 200175]
MNLPMCVFSQRLHNQTHFSSGCTATVWVLPAHAVLPVGVNGLLQAHCAQAVLEPFSLEELLDGDPSAHLCIKNQFIHHILQMLLNSPDFADYVDCDDVHFKPPPTVHHLPYSPDHIVKQHILRTIDQEEASYEGNDKAMEGYRYEDFNSFNQMDYTYLGIAATIGSLQQASDILQWKGLHKTEMKGPFWHHLHEALHHIGEAHFWATWLAISGTSQLSQLKNKSPAKLHVLAIKLEQDAVLTQWIMFNCDVLSYIELNTAMKCSDVGCMEDMLPTLLFRFVGGGNSKYTIEVLELMHGLKPEVIKGYCWLINCSSKPDGLTPVNKGQEQNIGDIKVTYHSFGPGATFKYLHKVLPAIPTFRAL